MLHLETLQSATRRQYASLQEEVASIPATITVTKDKPYSYVSDVFEDSVRILGRDTCIRRVHVKASDTGYYRNIGWMHDNDVHHCLVCLRSFGWFFDPKEHCHACGSIVCGSCVDKAMIVELKGCGDVTVGKCCYWGQEQITIVETRPPRSKIVYGDAHNRYNDTFNKSKSDSGSDSESLLDGNNINENETETVELFNLREDKSRLQMMDLLRQSADFAHSANVARSDSRDNNLSSLSKGGDRRRGANHYGTSFRPCSERMFAPYIEPPSLKSKSMDSNRHFRWLPSVSLTSRTCSEDFRARKAVSVDEPTRPHSANLRFFGGKQREVDALSEGMHPRSRILSEENDIVDFTLGGRHLHQGFRYDRDATGGDIVGYNTSSVAGQAMLTYDCMEFKQELCVHSIEARTLKEAAHRNNRVLLGWQVSSCVYYFQLFFARYFFQHCEPMWVLFTRLRGG